MVSTPLAQIHYQKVIKNKVAQRLAQIGLDLFKLDEWFFQPFVFFKPVAVCDWNIFSVLILIISKPGWFYLHFGTCQIWCINQIFLKYVFDKYDKWPNRNSHERQSMIIKTTKLIIFPIFLAICNAIVEWFIGSTFLN